MRANVVDSLNHVLQRCEESARILEYLPPDREALRERLGFVEELEALVHTAGGRRKKPGLLDSLKRFVARLFRSRSARALLDEKSRAEHQLLRSYESACESESPLRVSLVLLRQHDAIKRLSSRRQPVVAEKMQLAPSNELISRGRTAPAR